MTRSGLARGWLSSLALLLPAVLSAQTGWTVDVSAGRTRHDVLIPRVGTTNMIAGVHFGGEQGRWFHASAGAPLLFTVGAGGPFWGITGAGQRLVYTRHPWMLGMDVGGDLYAYGGSRFGERGGGATGQAVPLATLTRGPVELEMRSGVLYNRVVLPGRHTDRAVHDSGVRLAWKPGAGLDLFADGRWMRAGEGSYPYAGGSAQWNLGPAWAWGSAARWVSDSIPSAAYGVGVGVRVSQRAELAAEWQQDGGDPLYWNTPRRVWSVRMSYRLGRRAEAPSPFAPQIGRGAVTLRIPLDASATAPSVMGDFTAWEAVPMTRTDNAWTAKVPVRPGVHNYVFRTADGGWYLPPAAMHRVPDGMGGWNAVLVVP